MLDVLVTLKRMTNSEIARREKAEQQHMLEVDREDDGAVDEANTEDDFDLTQRTTYDIGQWTVPRKYRRQQQYPDDRTTLSIEILGPSCHDTDKCKNKISSHITVGFIKYKPPPEQVNAYLLNI